jgi:hypothetical protein
VPCPDHPATEPGVSVRPLNTPVEVLDTRDTLRPLLSYLHNPYLVLRFGTIDRASAEAPRTMATGRRTIERES